MITPIIIPTGGGSGVTPKEIIVIIICAFLVYG